MFDPPKCARYGCENRIQRERWLWTPGSVATCSPECAHALRQDSIVKDIGEVRRCARPGCLNAVKVKGQVHCSGRCAARVQVGEALGPTLYIPPQPPEDESLVPGQCARPGCSEPTKRGKNRYCSHACASTQTGGDRWEKVAPKMRYTKAVRDQQIRELYRFEVSRRCAS